MLRWENLGSIEKMLELRARRHVEESEEASLRTPGGTKVQASYASGMWLRTILPIFRATARESAGVW